MCHPFEIWVINTMLYVGELNCFLWRELRMGAEKTQLPEWRWPKEELTSVWALFSSSHDPVAQQSHLPAAVHDIPRGWEDGLSLGNSGLRASKAMTVLLHETHFHVGKGMKSARRSPGLTITHLFAACIHSVHELTDSAKHSFPWHKQSVQSLQLTWLPWFLLHPRALYVENR